MFLFFYFFKNGRVEVSQEIEMVTVRKVYNIYKGNHLYSVS